MLPQLFFEDFSYLKNSNVPMKNMLKPPKWAQKLKRQYLPDVQPTNIRVELVGGTRIGEGRVEVVDVDRGLRGTVCSDGWDDEDAAVVCRMLGYR